MALSHMRRLWGDGGAPTSAATPRRARGTPGLDWLIVVLNLIFVGGVCADVWSHRFFGPDNYVFSEYHVSFISALVLLGGVLAGAAWPQRRAGTPWHLALPVGYTLTFAMVVVFFAGTLVDQVGHWVFGFERGFEALMSPSHLLLFLTGGLALGGAVRACARRLAEAAHPGLLPLLPLLINVALVLAWVTLANVAWMPLTGDPRGFPMVEAARTANPDVGQGYGVARLSLQTAVLMGGLLWLTQAVQMPLGGFTVVLALYGTCCSILMGSAMLWPLWLLMGVASDGVYRWLRPAPRARARFMAFGILIPIILWGLFYGFLAVTHTGGGVWWSGYVWTGSLVYPGIIGGLLALLMSAGYPAQEVR